MILVIDNYDSFTYNLVDYCGKLTNTPIEVFRNDKITIETIKTKQPHYIIISPGPKTPTDAGISKDVIHTFSGNIPILGVCLGHQAIGEVFGGKTIKAKQLMHGKTSQMSHTNHPLFNSIPNPFEATRYHSLVTCRKSLSTDLIIIAQALDDNEIMAIAHKDHPTYGVQFHPESICSKDGLQLIKNFLKMS